MFETRELQVQLSFFLLLLFFFRTQHEQEYKDKGGYTLKPLIDFNCSDAGMNLFLFPFVPPLTDFQPCRESEKQPKPRTTPKSKP